MFDTSHGRQPLKVKIGAEQQIPAKIVHLDDEKVTLDMNHSLAGESLTFEIEVVGNSDTPTQALSGCGCDCSPDNC